MPSKKKKYNARFPAGRIKKIMQTDEEVGKVAQAVPIIISRTLELFVESLLTKTVTITVSRNAKTLTPSHLKQCILSESRFDFLKDLVRSIPDASVQEDNDNNAEVDLNDSTLVVANNEASSSRPTPVIQYNPRLDSHETCSSHENSSTENNIERQQHPKINIDLTNAADIDLPPPLIPINSMHFQPQQTHADSLYIDEDYDN